MAALCPGCSRAVGLCCGRPALSNQYGNVNAATSFPAPSLPPLRPTTSSPRCAAPTCCARWTRWHLTWTPSSRPPSLATRTRWGLSRPRTLKHHPPTLIPAWAVAQGGRLCQPAVHLPSVGSRCDRQARVSTLARAGARQRRGRGGALHAARAGAAHGARAHGHRRHLQVRSWPWPHPVDGAPPCPVACVPAGSY
jgi:hypothetical protein